MAHASHAPPSMRAPVPCVARSATSTTGPVPGATGGFAQRASREAVGRDDSLPAILHEAPFDALAPYLGTRTFHRRGTTLFHAGADGAALLVLCAGTCKTVLVTEDGSEDVAAFHMPHEFVGVDAVGSGVHRGTAVALDDVQVRTLRCDHLQDLVRAQPDAAAALIALLSLEIRRERLRTVLLYSMQVAQRLAGFLLDLSARFRRRGYSAVEFNLTMGRAEIGQYLGVQLETISRAFSWMHRHGVIEVQGKTIKLVDKVALRRILEMRSVVDLHR
jgi:CRP/FNR family transcriptional regulator, anaerobic regulatory protein